MTHITDWQRVFLFPIALRTSIVNLMRMLA